MLGETYERNKIHGSRMGTDDGCKLKEELEAIRKKPQEDWQKEWNNYKKENITKKLIPSALLIYQKEDGHRSPHHAAANRAWELRCL